MASSLMLVRQLLLSCRNHKNLLKEIHPPFGTFPHSLLSWGWETEQNMTILVHGGAGEPCFLPQQFRTHKPIASPIEYTHLWVKDVAGQFQGGVCEVRVS